MNTPNAQNLEALMSGLNEISDSISDLEGLGALVLELVEHRGRSDRPLDYITITLMNLQTKLQTNFDAVWETSKEIKRQVAQHKACTLKALDIRSSIPQ